MRPLRVGGSGGGAGEQMGLLWTRAMLMWNHSLQNIWIRYAGLLVSVFIVFILSSTQINSANPFLKYQLHDELPDENSFKDGFSDVFEAFATWDKEVGCHAFREKLGPLNRSATPSPSSSLQNPLPFACSDPIVPTHVSILVKRWTWIPDNLDNLYSCPCGLSCLWTKSSVLADAPDAELYESSKPPSQRHQGDPLRVYLDLEPGRKSTFSEDIFVTYHAGDTVQATYAGSSFHALRNYHVSSVKNQDVLVYWSSSRCLPERMGIAGKLLSLLPHHSFGKCLNNVGGADVILTMYPECKGSSDSGGTYWSSHLHCAMSHYKFVLAVENTMTESYVTEKLFYALDAGAVPIYFGAPNVWDFVPPNSIIDASKFSSLQTLASYVKRVAVNPVLYAEYHAWRRCGVIGNYHHTRAVSLDSLPCRLCATVHKFGGKTALAS